MKAIFDSLLDLFFSFLKHFSKVQKISKGATNQNEVKGKSTRTGTKHKHLLIDPGHGRFPKGGGFVWQRPVFYNFREDLLTMQVGQRLKALFEEIDNSRVWWTRSFTHERGLSGFPRFEEGAFLNLKTKIKDIPGKSNYAKDVHSRWKFANYLDNKYGLDYFISIHFNLSRNHLAHGIEIWVKDLRTRELANLIINNIRRHYPGLTNRGVKIEGSKQWGYKKLAVLRMCNCPALLIECCFYDSKKDKRFLNSAFFDQVALAVYEGLEERE